MKFRLGGTWWEIRLALRRVESVKNEIVVSDIEEIHNYLAKFSRVDTQEVKNIIDDAKETA